MNRSVSRFGASRGRLSRRELLRSGTLRVCGLSGAMSALCSLPPESAVAGDGQPRRTAASFSSSSFAFGRAKRCLLLYIYGAWSQLDTFDPKPEAPEEIRGEFGTIASCLPEASICEHLPLSSRVLDRCTLVRSMSHPWNIHSASYTLTGNPDTERIEGRQRHPDQWPYLGGIVDWFAARGRFGATPRGTPVNVMLPWRQSLFARPNKRSGTFGGFLGTAYDPLWTEFRGDAPQGDPFRQITPEGRFEFGGTVTETTADAAPLGALERRRALLAQVERKRTDLDRAAAVRGYERQRALALDFLASPTVKEALRLEREPAALREAYGYTLFGQACLSARRLLESDVKFVTVVWDEFGQTDESWDTHYDHHPRMKEFLLPAFDRAFSTLMLDLARRGLLDDTLVMCLSEHGRTPRFDVTSLGVGRGHWSRAYCQLFAGAGVPRGQVVGASDGTAADVVDRPLDPKDVLCTACHLLGLDPREELEATPGRRVPLVSGGQVIRELLG